MKPVRSLEFATGLFLLLGLAGIVLLAMESTNLGGAVRGDSYRIFARFTNIGDLKPRAPVTVAGVSIGVVESVSLDPESFEAVVTMRISRAFGALPSDTAASVLTSGVLGDQYVGLEPGGSPEMLGDGDQILITQSALVLEQLIGKYLFNTGSDGSGDRQ
jgi:phospholipid/cholesterol/gamma-HCH transport system substrate-binding protein